MKTLILSLTQTKISLPQHKRLHLRSSKNWCHTTNTKIILSNFQANHKNDLSKPLHELNNTVLYCTESCSLVSSSLQYKHNPRTRIHNHRLCSTQTTLASSFVWKFICHCSRAPVSLTVCSTGLAQSNP